MAYLEFPTDDEWTRMTAQIKQAAGVKLTRQEIFEQKVSYVHSAMPAKSKITREEVVRLIREHEGDL